MALETEKSGIQPTVGSGMWMAVESGTQMAEIAVEPGIQPAVETGIEVAAAEKNECEFASLSFHSLRPMSTPTFFVAVLSNPLAIRAHIVQLLLCTRSCLLVCCECPISKFD